MGKKVAYYLVDAFTERAFGGNAAGVVPEGEALTEQEMQQIARELNQSETAFLRKSEHIQADFRIRYFTPAEEINFCGHATVATAWLLASEYGWNDKEQVVFETNVGLVPVRFEREEGILQRVTMTQVAPKVKDFHLPVSEIAGLVGIPETEIDARYPIRLSNTGNWHLLVPVKSWRAIDEAQPRLAELAEMNREYEISTTHLFTFDTQGDIHDLYTRDFCPAIGIPEDPVTGAANGALAGYLVLEGILSGKDTHELLVAQGNAIGRPGTLKVTILTGDGTPVIQVGGAAHLTAAGDIRL
ncbi:PhzF family phenazine biosynthesis protein [Brevibacillus migulae]|uniref:PhzF family phenazine biosynthesis protein n=1 Tax=Brevibacillus migulae TaxID=1644114 RepID=UPI00106E47AF|nr:PhzF family phenazine biosynthesis protein [Brevibacillus migulae]